MSVELITANHAAGKAAAMAGRANRLGRGFGGGVYPITPQTECIEYLSRQQIEKGSIIRAESEHSAMAICMGFSFAGARSFTASSSNGLAYMVENVISSAMMRLPIVMMAVNRTLGPPWNIWVDHGDTLMLRDSGWLQFYCEDNQEVFDSLLCAFRLAEDHRVLLPVMICQDAFVLSHTMMLTDLAEQELVDSFLPPLDLPHRVSDIPRTIGGLDFPHEAEIHRRQHAEAMQRVPRPITRSRTSSKRSSGDVLPMHSSAIGWRMRKSVLISMGTTAATARAAVDAARKRGIKAGSLRVRMFRPFPEQELREAMSGIPRIAVLDRDLSPGMGGVLWSELRALADHDSILQGYVLGLGGGDIRPEHLTGILDEMIAREASADPEDPGGELMAEPILAGMAHTELDREEPLLRAGNTNCGGCGMSVALQLISRAIAEHQVQFVIPACCGIVTAGAYPNSAYAAPVIASTFASAAAVASGLAHVARLNAEPTRVICFAGDGGTYDIGMATISGAAERDEDLLFICYDNEIYGNTGGQRSSATPLGAVTSTTHAGKEVPKKDVVAILAAHGIPYAATVSLAHPDDAMRKIRHAISLKGFRFLHILAPCPTGWKSEPSQGIELVRLAVDSGLYPVYEISAGDRLEINIDPAFSAQALERYFASQGRFKGGVNLAKFQADITRHWHRLRMLAKMSPVDS